MRQRCRGGAEALSRPPAPAHPALTTPTHPLAGIRSDAYIFLMGLLMGQWVIMGYGERGAARRKAAGPGGTCARAGGPRLG